VTGSYDLRIKRSAEKELRAVSRPDLPKLIDRIRSLAREPRPPGCQKLSGQEAYRVRQGDYRVIYTVNDQARLIEIVKVGHRKEVSR
jgi:mRNA interferase RelE/StbE